MYDDTCRFLAEHFSADFASWLLGAPIALTEIEPSELSLEPIRADALILLQSEATILHLEFQTRPKTDIPFRMLDYRVRSHRRYPRKTMRQVVIYLQATGSELARETQFSLENTTHNFEVIRLWEQPAETFLQYPGLLPFATLGQSTSATTTLRQVAQNIDQIADPTAKANLAAASAILAGLKLEEAMIYRLLRRDIMQESTVYQSIKREGELQGEARGEAKKQREIALNLLRNNSPLQFISDITGMSLEAVQQLKQEIDA
ncbi:Rpn family recombination-promoting nuclease/putative transposase [filamentous cyanobacterium LEGE 11480]|uniref:Rpn family recombination-promoting nuclease/putative transposase n=1 Tax=Romeriopsis navalis LEGE 11480 TaxID=2777977 RepID=A0A928VQE1_9CYAN|nr:Rpn family recombination-promoting nuclease/putative transposase [Romeriopsis navalis]MBE9030622.1 Rpn family recombination-promoting nuclease/putative transposase [Romeriopsis navalis LEGE 11480]